MKKNSILAGEGTKAIQAQEGPYVETGKKSPVSTTHFHVKEDGMVYFHDDHQEGTVHRHVHSAEEKKAVVNRLSKAIGHMEAVKRMVEDDADCSEVLIQLAAVRSAINSTGKVILKNHMSRCIVEAIEEKDDKAIRALNEAIDKFIK